MSSPAKPCSVDTNIPLDASLSTLRGDSSSSLSILTFSNHLAIFTFCRLVSGDYRGFVMIWEVEDIKEELVSLERRMKNLPKDRWVSFLHTAISDTLVLTISRNLFHNPPRKERSEGIFFIRPGSRLVQQQGRTDVAEVILLQNLGENVLTLNAGGSAQFLIGAQWQCHCLIPYWEGHPHLWQQRQVNWEFGCLW